MLQPNDLRGSLVALDRGHAPHYWHDAPEESRYDERLRWDSLIQILSRFWITSTTSGGNQMLFRGSAIFSGG